MNLEINQLKPGHYYTDLYNLNPIFLIKNKSSTFKSKNSFVRSWGEALELSGNPVIKDINLDYIGSFIAGTPRADLSPYKNILRLPRSSSVVINKNGDYQIKYRDPFIYENKPLEKEKFKQKLRTIFFDLINSQIGSYQGHIGAELSGGLDSNLIFGTLLNKLGEKNKHKLHSFSYRIFNELGPINLCRDFYELPKSNSHLININNTKKDLIFKILGYLPQTECFISNCESFYEQNCNLVFSGLGGDECISNYGNNIPTDLINENRFNELFKWSVSKNRFLKILIKRYFHKFFPSLFARKYLINPNSFLAHKILCSNLTQKMKISVDPLLSKRHAWAFDTYSETKISIKKRLLQDYLALRVENEYRISSYFGIKKCFPLLNQELINLILEQDVLIFADDALNKRSLLKNVFRDLLPEHLNLNTTKDFYASYGFKFDNKKVHIFLNNFINKEIQLHPYIEEIWNINSFRNNIKQLLSDNLNNNLNLFEIYTAIKKVIQLNNWFLFIENNQYQNQ